MDQQPTIQGMSVPYPTDAAERTPNPASNAADDQPDQWGVDGPLCPECREEMTHQTHSGNADYWACPACGHIG